jgi:hypothetical protein
MPLFNRILDHVMPAAQPVRPAVLRIAVGAFSAVNNGRRRSMFRKIHRTEEAKFKPVGVVKLLRKPLPPRVADALFDAAQLTNALALIGVGHRVTGPANAALQLWTISYRNSWSMILHNDNMLVLHQMVLGLSSSADSLSVDSLVREQTLLPRRFDRAYGVVGTGMNVAAAAVYFISGVAKVRSPLGWGWARGTALRDQIAADAVRKDVFGTRPPGAAATVYKGGDVFGPLAAGALAVELGAPLSLLHRRGGQVFAVAAWAMHVGIRIVMGIKFNYNLSGISYLGFFPVGPELGRR